MKPRIKLLLKDTQKSVDVYSAQFEYQDLFERLSKVKKLQQMNKPLFQSFDTTWLPSETAAKRTKKRRTNKENIKTAKGNLKNNLDLGKVAAKPTHRRNFTDQFLQSELIPLFTPSFNIYYKNKNSSKRRRKSVEI